MIKPKIESEMQFIFPYDNCFFPIEEWTQKINLHKVRPVEYAYFDRINRMLLIEAKKSSPRPIVNGDNVKYDEFIEEIFEKIVHSIDMLFSTLVNYREHDLPEKFRMHDYSNTNIIVFLVIKGHKPEWTVPIEKSLKVKLRGHMSIWRLNVKVITDETAAELNLIERI